LVNNKNWAKKHLKSRYECDEGKFHLGIKENFLELWKFIITIILKSMERDLLHKIIILNINNRLGGTHPLAQNKGAPS
jgi:hypothetical protein